MALIVYLDNYSESHFLWESKEKIPRHNVDKIYRQATWVGEKMKKEFYIKGLMVQTHEAIKIF